MNTRTTPFPFRRNYSSPSCNGRYTSDFNTPQDKIRDDEAISDTSSCIGNYNNSPYSVDGSSSISSSSSFMRDRSLSTCSVNVSPLLRNSLDCFSSPPSYETYEQPRQLINWSEYFFSLSQKQSQVRTRKTASVYQQLYTSSYMKRYRSVVCDWFFEIQYALSLSQRLVHVATLYMDICMYRLYSTNRVACPSTNIAPGEGLFSIKQYLQLLAASCLWISTKRDETYGDSKLKLDTLVQYCCGMYTKQNFQEMEAFVLDLLEWELEDTPSIDFLDTMMASDSDLSSEDDMEDEESSEEETFNNFKESVKHYSKMIIDSSILNTLVTGSNKEKMDTFEQLKQLFNIHVPSQYVQQLEHTYISLWITMLNYPSLLALSSLLSGLFLYHLYESPFEQGQLSGIYQSADMTTLEQFEDVLSHYWTSDMEMNIGYSLEQVAICSRILYTFFHIEQSKTSVEEKPKRETQRPSNNTRSETTHGLDQMNLACNEQL
ncbi:cyclin box fold domain-containing protein [Naegleria gruberi]|uniref:Cyclin box fold domain-containing protein n=1 Tax=Naegleria gruberi TaxID=5762 RepID=D2VKD7_NAEGR|nr:cyclin box fold domain-containing protein [Naegleria gruberi]EFC42581.1 cyclin box fold domain-containing protein [Naegleria gruberi]|eukprot:XP_002675325.1 cyclin box fold domain-containing protein [Naegleria gruberi strain NEG-M]